MGILIGIDYGEKRTGIAVTDPLQIIASPLCTLSPEEVPDFLRRYCRENAVEGIVVGQPKHTHSTEAPVAVEAKIEKFIASITAVLPAEIPIERYDERFTSKIAALDLAAAGVPKNRRREKGVLDRTSAALILRDYMAWRQQNR